MKCVLPSQNVKILARALHSLSRIGDELCVEARSNVFALRTVNMAESAYAVFTFFECFFSSYNYSGSDDNDDDNSIKCMISMKSCLSVFKTPTCMDKQIDWCQIRLKPDATQLVFKIRYVYGSTKTHFLPILENLSLDIDYDAKNNTINRLCVTPKLLGAVIRNFRPNIDEITLFVMSDRAILQTHVDNKDSKKSVRTEVCLQAGEFEAFTVGVETSITFCMKELRAVLAFAEPTSLPVVCNFDTHGRPVVFIINNSGVYEANYVVATRNINAQFTTTSQTTESSFSGKSITTQLNRKRTHDAVDSEDFAFPTEVASNKSVSVKNHRDRLCSEPLDGHNVSDKNIDRINSCLTNVETSKRNPPDNVAMPSTSTYGLTGVDRLSLEEELECDEVLGSPPPSIVRTVFGRCFNATFHKRMLPGYDKVLAYDSDGMEDSD